LNINHNANLDKTSNNDILPLGMLSKERPMPKKFVPNSGAIHFHGKVFRRRFLKNQLLKESAWVTFDSLTVLEEFERFEEEFLLNETGTGSWGVKENE
jgi:hypothetical protein